MQARSSSQPQNPPRAAQAIQRCLFVGLGGIGQRHLRNLRTLLGQSIQVSAYRVRRELQTLDDNLQVVPGVDLEQKYGVEVCSDITPLTNEAIVRGLAKNPDDRFQSYDEMILALTISRSELLIKKFGGG